MMFQDILVGVMGIIVVAVAIWVWRMDHCKGEEEENSYQTEKEADR